MRYGELAPLVVDDTVQLGLVPTVQGDWVAVAIYDTQSAPERMVEEVDIEIGGTSVILASFTGVTVAIDQVLGP